jgi:hypothetical protein
MATQPVRTSTDQTVRTTDERKALNVYRVVYVLGRKEAKPAPAHGEDPDQGKEQWVNTGVHETVNVVAEDGTAAGNFAADDDEAFGQIVSITQIASDVLISSAIKSNQTVGRTHARASDMNPVQPSLTPPAQIGPTPVIQPGTPQGTPQNPLIKP